MKVLSLKLIRVVSMVLDNKPKLNQTVSKGFASCDGERRKVSIRMMCLAMLNTTTASVKFFEKKFGIVIFKHVSTHTHRSKIILNRLGRYLI